MVNLSKVINANNELIVKKNLQMTDETFIQESNFFFISEENIK